MRYNPSHEITLLMNPSHTDLFSPQPTQVHSFRKSANTMTYIPRFVTYAT